MTSRVGRIAGVSTILEAAWVLYLEATAVPRSSPGTALTGFNLPPLFAQAIIALAFVLLADGLIGLWGARFAFTAGAVLSAALLLMVGFRYWVESGYQYQSASAGDIVAVVLAAVGAIANVMAMRTKSRLSEQANPMNLPVFG